jgi:hypothetical protein
MSYEGTIVLNYRLTRTLGEGGFGVVYLAEHTELGRKAACKILHREFAGKPEVVDRFFREAKAVCAIGHRAIIDIENFGRLPNGEPFYLMEYFPGESLADRMQRSPLHAAELVTVFDAVASALTAAHGKQIIHRDLKPENIMVLEEGAAIVDVKLLDFGIAKLISGGNADAVRSRSGLPMGTPSYMAPEQALDSKNVDARADVYSFAATIYAAIAGTPPFVGESVAAVLIKAQSEAPEPLARRVPWVSATLERAVMRCLEKQPAQRPTTIAEAWREIRHALGSVSPLPAGPLDGIARTLAPDAPTIYPQPARAASSGATPAAATTTLGSAAAQTGARERSRGWWAIGALVAVVAAGVTFALTRTASHGGSVETATNQPVSPVPAEASTIVDTMVSLDAAPVVMVDAAVVETADAAAPTDTDVKRPAKSRPPAKPDKTKAAGSATPPVSPPPVEAPKLSCSVQSFAAVYDKASPASDEVDAALARLNKCKAQLDPQRFQQIQKNLISKF